MKIRPPHARVDYTAEIAQMRQRVARGNALLAQRRLVVCMGSRMALTLFISASDPGPELVGATTTEAEGLARLQDGQADVLLCTDRLEQGNGGSLVAAAKQLPQPPSTLMIVTQPRRLATIRTAQRAGCDGLCLESQIGHGTVLRALSIVTAGAMYLEQALSEQYFRLYPGLGAPPLARLSERELQVLEGITAGIPNRDIAARLLISPETVKSHLAQIYRKLPARDRAHAAVKGIRLGLVEWPEDR